MTNQSPPLVERPGWMGDNLWAVVEPAITPENAAEVRAIFTAEDKHQAASAGSWPKFTHYKNAVSEMIEAAMKAIRGGRA